MTSRLKKKLDNIGVDASSTKLTESFCLIGTPLPSLDKTKDSNEFVPVWKQDVRDEQGRRRLHGAFTGGFSAGYFNTVGSKEGWTPSTFKSSRSARATNNGARPEDFMDEEDLEELRNSKRMVHTTEEMDITGGTEAEKRKRMGPSVNDDPMASAVAATLLPPTKDSIGAQLLKKMGWRLGQGVGPRVTYEQLRKQDLLSSSALVLASGNGLDEDDEAKKHSYAPRNTVVTIFRPKENSFGLGYVPGAALSEMLRDQGSEESPGAPKISAGFGLGALNDAEDDDVDVYDSGAAHRPSRGLAYDAREGREKKTLGSHRDRPPLRPRDDPASTSQSTFHDGRPVLMGFVLSDEPVVEDVWFQIPEVPEDWEPNPQTLWLSESTPTATTPTTREPWGGPRDATRWKPGGITAAEERAAKLGEIGLPSQKSRSVFEYLSQKDRDRLQGIISSGMPSEKSVDRNIPTTSRTVINIPTIDAGVARAALHGFQPFNTDPVKHSRYISYIQSQAYPSTSPNYTSPPALKPGQAIDDFNKEMEDYAKAAAIFKPMSGAIANRFTSASIMDTDPTIQEGLHRPADTQVYLSVPSKDDSKLDVQAEETPRQNAARLGMYGPLTREVSEWTPARLLHKRFGVRNPRPDGGAPGGHDNVSTSSAAAMPPPPTSIAAWDPTSVGVSFQPASTVSTSGSSIPSSSGPKDLANIGFGEDDDQGRDTLTYEKPVMDIFKAIFESDDEDSDEDKDEDQKTIPPATSHVTAEVLPATTETPSKASTPPPEPPAKDVDGGPVDPNLFRPKFVSKAKREGESKILHDSGDDVGKKSKKSRKSVHSKMLVSFDMDVDGGSPTVVVDVKKEKEKERKKPKRPRDELGPGQDLERRAKRSKDGKRNNNEEDEGEWVEKAPILPPRGTPRDNPIPRDSGDEAKRGRMRASDFL